MEEAEVLYAKWLNGEISDEALQAAEGVDALVELQKVVNAVDQWSMPQYNTAAGYEKLNKKYLKDEKQTKGLKKYKLIGITISLILLAFLLQIFLGSQTKVISSKSGENKHFAFEDGSQIRLNDGSNFEYNSKNWDSDRLINLTGEAFFEVEKGSPFVVNTKNGTIKVLGTQFNVRAWGENLYVECYEGKVQVSVDDQEVILIANEAINVVSGRQEAKRQIVNTKPLWQNGTSRFYNENLLEVFKELERQYDVQIKVSPMSRSFSGNFRHDDLQTALREICKPLGLSYTISEDEKTILIE